MVMLSTSKLVIPFKSVCVPPKEILSLPIVIDELLNLELPILPASLEAAILPANIVFVTVPLSPVPIKLPVDVGSVKVIFPEYAE